jgi:hypothetical protein
MQSNGLVMHSLPRVVLVALLVLSGCDAISASGSAARESPTVAPTAPPPASRGDIRMTPSSLDYLEGLDCDAEAGTCSTPGYAISGSPTACEHDGASFGAISDNSPVDAVSRLQGAKVVATLASGQFVCIHYTAQPTTPDGDPWLYVTAISPHHVPACKTVLCGDPEARSTWVDGRGGTCTVQDERYSAACPAGWVRGTSVDAYSMGL